MRKVHARIVNVTKLMSWNARLVEALNMPSHSWQYDCSVEVVGGIVMVATGDGSPGVGDGLYSTVLGR